MKLFLKKIGCAIANPAIVLINILIFRYLMKKKVRAGTTTIPSVTDDINILMREVKEAGGMWVDLSKTSHWKDNLENSLEGNDRQNLGKKIRKLVDAKRIDYIFRTPHTKKTGNERLYFVWNFSLCNAIIILLQVFLVALALYMIYCATFGWVEGKMFLDKILSIMLAILDFALAIFTSGFAIVIYFIVAFTIWGYFKVGVQLRKNKYERDFFKEFVENCNAFLRSVRDVSLANQNPNEPIKINVEPYNWLLHNKSAAQEILRIGCVVDNMKEILRIIRQDGMYTDWHIIARISAETYDYFREYEGKMLRNHEMQEQKDENPFVWFQIGVSDFIALPIWVFAWVKIINNAQVRKFLSGSAGKLYIGFCSLVGLFAGLITITEKWHSLIDWMKG